MIVCWFVIALAFQVNMPPFSSGRIVGPQFVSCYDTICSGEDGGHNKPYDPPSVQSWNFSHEEDIIYKIRALWLTTKRRCRCPLIDVSYSDLGKVETAYHIYKVNIIDNRVWVIAPNLTP